MCNKIIFIDELKEVDNLIDLGQRTKIWRINHMVIGEN
jgi:hypothetical protein